MLSCVGGQEVDPRTPLSQVQVVGHQAGEKFPKVNNEFKKIFVVIEINMSFWFGKAYKYFWLKTKRLTS